jgi:hypothetical protein
VQHERKGEWEEGKDQSWSTEFGLYEIMFPDRCEFCCERLERQLENLRAFSPDHPVSVLFTSTPVSPIKFKFVDTEDGMSEWTYWLWHKFSEEERKSLGSSV